MTPEPPPGVVIVVMDSRGYTDENMRGKPYMWCWVDGETWFRVEEHLVPESYKLRSV